MEKPFVIPKEFFLGEVGFEYWWKWQVPVCALIVLIPAVACLVLCRKLDEGTKLSHGCLWVPCWRKLDPKWLLLYRALAFLYTGWLLYQMIACSGIFVFYFYTQWTLAIVVAYFGIAVILSAQGCWFNTEKASFKGKEKVRSNSHEESSLDKAKESAGFWGHVMHKIYQVSAAASILTDLVFWLVLAPLLSRTELQLTPIVVLIHTVNLLSLIIDSSLNNLPFEWSGFPYFAWWSVTYAAFQWALHAFGGFNRWPYPFLDLMYTWAPLCYLGVVVFHLPCYGICIWFTKAMTSTFSRLYPDKYIRLYDETPQREKTM